MVERRFPGHRGPGPELARGRCPAAPGAGGREPDRYVANGRPAVLKARGEPEAGTVGGAGQPPLDGESSRSTLIVARM
jgi:hypothetical protein